MLSPLRYDSSVYYSKFNTLTTQALRSQQQGEDAKSGENNEISPEKKENY